MEAKKTDVTAVGELLIDLVQRGTGPQGTPLFEANPGGAPANVLAMLGKLGRRCAFIGKVGRQHGFLRETPRVRRSLPSGRRDRDQRCG